MKNFKILSLFLLFGGISISAFAQTVTKDKICYQNASEKLQFIKEADKNKFRIQSIEKGGNSVNFRVFMKQLAFEAGDIFTENLLKKSIKNLNRLKEVSLISLEDVAVSLNRENKGIGIAFCVYERREN